MPYTTLLMYGQTGYLICTLKNCQLQSAYLRGIVLPGFLNLLRKLASLILSLGGTSPLFLTGNVWASLPAIEDNGSENEPARLPGNVSVLVSYSDNLKNVRYENRLPFSTLGIWGLLGI